MALALLLAWFVAALALAWGYDNLILAKRLQREMLWHKDQAKMWRASAYSAMRETPPENKVSTAKKPAVQP